MQAIKHVGIAFIGWPRSVYRAWDSYDGTPDRNLKVGDVVLARRVKRGPYWGQDWPAVVLYAGEQHQIDPCTGTFWDGPRATITKTIDHRGAYVTW